MYICMIPKSTTFGHTKNLGIWSMNPFYRWVSDRMLPTYDSTSHSLSSFLTSVNGRTGSSQTIKRAWTGT
jgi:hypothetical protein